MAVIREALERIVIVTGGTGKTGLPTVVELGRHQLVPLVLVRDVEKFIDDPARPGKKIKIGFDQRTVDFQNRVEDTSGVRPRIAKGDLAEIDTQDKASQVVDGFNLEPEQKVHYAPIAAEGINSYVIALRRDLREVKRGFEQGTLTENILRQATEVILSHSMTDERMRLAMQSNCIAHTFILDELIRRKHLDNLSVVATLGSTFSADMNVRTGRYLSKYPGPEFYYPIGFSLMRQAEEARSRAAKYGFKAIDVIAPEIHDTTVGELLEEFATWISAVYPDSPISIPSMRTDDVARIFVEQMLETMKRGERFTRVFIGSVGREVEGVFDHRPLSYPDAVLKGYL